MVRPVNPTVGTIVYAVMELYDAAKDAWWLQASDFYSKIYMLPLCLTMLAIEGAY